jgi:hypothetical protein
MKTIHLIVLVCSVFLLSGCHSLKLPLAGTALHHPIPMDRGLGFRVGGGYGTLPCVAGTVPEARTADGKLINPIPVDSGKTLASMVNLEAALGFSSRLDLGFSVYRGVYANVKVLESKRWVVALSPAYARTGENTNETEGWVSNVNVAATAAFKISPAKRVTNYLYVGAAVNNYSTRILDKGSNREFTASRTAPQVLGGIGFRLAAIEIGGEASGTHLKWRDGRSEWVPTVSVMANLGWF